MRFPRRSLLLELASHFLLYFSVIIACSGCVGGEIKKRNTNSVKEEKTTLFDISLLSSANIDTRTLQEFKNFVRANGWPTQDKVGADGIIISARLLLSSGDDPNFQEECLDQMLDLVGVELDARAYSYLNDSIQLSHKRPQQIGTHFSVVKGKVEPIGQVDLTVARTVRSQFAMPPLSEEIAKIQSNVDKGFSIQEAAGTIPKLPISPPTNQALRKELLEMVSRDQAPRSSKATPSKIQRTDSENLVQLKGILETNGIPGREAIGLDGVFSLFLLIQHTSIEMQAKYLPRFEQLMREGSFSRAAYAMLFDRVQIGEGKEQRYGTQRRSVGAEKVLYPVEDAEGLNGRRETAGLPPIEKM